MAEQLCPACGCVIVGAGYEKEGVTYCCQPCASGSSNQCDCGCCAVTEESEEE
jgi:hypothetical protein